MSDIAARERCVPEGWVITGAKKPLGRGHHLSASASDNNRCAWSEWIGMYDGGGHSCKRQGPSEGLEGDIHTAIAAAEAARTETEPERSKPT